MGNNLTVIGQLTGQATKLGLLSFDQVNRLGTIEEKREQILARCQQVYELAHGKQRMLKGGDTCPDPDYHAMVKCLELTANLMGLQADATRRVNKPEESERRAMDIEQVAALMRSVGYEVKKVA
jgi:hypothetical protein